eukprot:355816_1
MSSVYLLDNTFNNIKLFNSIIDADHTIYFDRATRAINITGTNFDNIILSQSLLNFRRSSNDFNYGASMMINDCIFHNVSVGFALFDDDSYACDFSISNTIIDIISGSIYYSTHSYPSYNTVNNVSIASTQLYEIGQMVGFRKRSSKINLYDKTSFGGLNSEHEYTGKYGND